MFTGLQEYKQSNSTEWLRMTKKLQGKEEAVRPPLRCHWKRIRLRLSTCHLRIQISDVSNRTCIACIALYSIVGLQLPIASHSILQSINVHCILLIFYCIIIFRLFNSYPTSLSIPFRTWHRVPTWWWRWRRRRIAYTAVYCFTTGSKIHFHRVSVCKW